MTTPPESRQPSASDDHDAMDNTAATWVARRDRGLTPAEQDEFLQWLAADPRHGERLARFQRGWGQLAQLALWRPEHADTPNPDLLLPAPPSRNKTRYFRRWIAPATFAMAAALWLVFGGKWTTTQVPAPSVVITATGYRQELLTDGTRVELSDGTHLAVTYTTARRHVRLEHGEALFQVAKNPARPFLVEAAGVTVEAVGTAFTVGLKSDSVEVLVTEGRVRINHADNAGAVNPVIEAGHRVIIGPNTQAPEVRAVSALEIDRMLSWQPRMLEFDSTPLADVAREFNRHNRVQIVVADAALRALPIGASFRSDNVEGFVRLLEASFGIQVERTGTTLTLRGAR